MPHLKACLPIINININFLMIWQFPGLLKIRIEQNDVLRPMFQNMPKACFDHMMFTIITRVERGYTTVTEQTVSRARHANLGITHAIYNAFVSECRDIIENVLKIPDSKRYIDALEQMRHLFVFDLEVERRLLLEEIMHVYNHARVHEAFADVASQLLAASTSLI